ncbi:hypothetical protein NIES2104_67230 [Leptolyngbya sp. NIES-2104]|nr:hypothetical protein NIES2104_67230 [Leptolyngbya sp. NIES-2104]
MQSDTGDTAGRKAVTRAGSARVSRPCQVLIVFDRGSVTN